MSEEFMRKRGAIREEQDLKLSGDKIKLESRPGSKETTASSKCSLLVRGQARPLSAVPSLTLYSKDDYDVDIKTRRPYSAGNIQYNKSNNRDRNKDFATSTEESTSLESLDEEKDLPSSQIFRTLMSESIKSYRSASGPKKETADAFERVAESPYPEEGLKSEHLQEQKDPYPVCILTPGLTTKPPLPKKTENKNPSKTSCKGNNLLSDDEIEIIRLKTLKFEEDFVEKYEKNDLEDKDNFKLHEIMSEREFNSFLERTQSDIEKSIYDNFVGDGMDFQGRANVSAKSQKNSNNTEEDYTLQCSQSLSDRQYNFPETPELLTSKSDNDVLLSKSDKDLNFRNWLSEDKDATKRVSKSEERTDTFLKNLKSQHEEIDKCINKAQKVLDKTKRTNFRDCKDLDEDAAISQRGEDIDLKFNKFFQQPPLLDPSAEKLPKKILKNTNSKSAEPKINKTDLPHKKKDKLNNMNETRRNKLKSTAKPLNSFKESAIKECQDEEESWMSKFPSESNNNGNNKDEEEGEEEEFKEDLGPPSFNSTAINPKGDDNNAKVTEWLQDEGVSNSTAKNPNFLDILENVEDLDVATRVVNREILDNEVRTEVSETNTYDDIVQILEVLEAEDRKSHLNMESMKDIVSQELCYQRHKKATNIRHENIPAIRITDANSRSGSATSKSSDQGLGSTSSLSSCASNYNQILSFLDEVDRNSSKTLTCAKERVQQVAKVVEHAIRLDTIPKREDLLSLNNEELCDQIVDLNLRLKDKSSSIKLLQEELSTVRDHVLKLTRQTEEIIKQKLRGQKEEHEAVVRRHQKFIDQLISDKKALNHQCEGLISEIKMVEDRNASNAKAIEHRHQVELKKAKEMQMAGEKIRRERWIDSKTQKIKELTVKSLEPELQSMTVRHQQEITDLRSLHKKELEDLELKGARKTQQQCEALREQLAEEREKALAHERDIMRLRYEKLVETEEKSYQEQRRRLQQEHANRLIECEERENAAIAERDRMIKQTQEEFEDKVQTIIRRHNNEIKLLKETAEMETEAWKNNYRKQQTIQMIEKESKLRDQFKKERDREIEEVIERLEAEATESRMQMEQATENRIRRIKEKFENEIHDCEQSERETQTKYAESKGKLLECEDTIIGLRANAKQLEIQLKETREALNKMNNKRNDLKDIVRQEMKQDIESLEKEVTRLREEKDKELQQVYSRVKIAVAKKDEVLSELTRDHAALQEKCIYLENMLEQQRKEYLIK